MITKNIEYKSKELVQFYRYNRQRWEEFYPSERWMFKRIAANKKNMGDILDVGCACGGLASALSEKFTINSYTGIDINKGNIDWARRCRKLAAQSRFIYGDILKQKISGKYDMVVSLSCADWNVETASIVNSCWKKLKPNGHLAITLRLTPGQGINDIKKSYQYINFSGDEKNPEIANYVVFNFKDVLKLINGLFPLPESIGAYGYWGKPSSTAVTPFDKLIFSAFYIKKAADDHGQGIQTEFDLPIEVFL